MKAYWGSRDVNPLIQNLAFLLLEKEPLYELSSRLVGSRNQFGYLKEKNSLSLPEKQTSITQLTV